MSDQIEELLSQRYWLTDEGWAAAREAEKKIKDGELEPLESDAI